VETKKFSAEKSACAVDKGNGGHRKWENRKEESWHMEWDKHNKKSWHFIFLMDIHSL
jgi:hypothetical protein